MVRRPRGPAKGGIDMRQSLRAAVAAVALLVAHDAAAQQIADPITWTRGFAERFVTQGGLAAYEYWAEATRVNFNAEGQQQFRGVLVDTAPQPGTVRRLSTLTEERADDRFMRVRALYHLGANPFLITFYFYRPDNEWRMTSWATTNQAGEIPLGPPSPVPVGVVAPTPVVPQAPVWSVK